MRNANEEGQRTDDAERGESSPLVMNLES
jgi:hypothetical protein